MPRKPPPVTRKPPLTIPMILRDADAWHAQHGEWPKKNHHLEWRRIDNALRNGLRGLPGGSSLARLLDERWGVRNKQDLPRLTVRKILAWVDRHHQQTGDWPTEDSGPVDGQPGEKWGSVTAALQMGLRGLPGGSSLARILVEHRGVRNRMALPPLTTKLILSWVDAYHKRKGRWPHRKSGAISDAPGERWNAVDLALKVGYRGLPGGSTLAGFVLKHWPKATVKT